MSKALEENKLAVLLKRLLREFNSYWKLMSGDDDSDKNKNNLPPPLQFQFF